MLETVVFAGAGMATRPQMPQMSGARASAVACVLAWFALASDSETDVPGQ